MEKGEKTKDKDTESIFNKSIEENCPKKGDAYQGTRSKQKTKSTGLEKRSLCVPESQRKQYAGRLAKMNGELPLVMRSAAQKPLHCECRLPLLNSPTPRGLTLNS